MSTARVLIYVQHLVGVGHYKRAAMIARAAAAHGLDVTVLSGGSAIPGIGLGEARLIQLPPAHAHNEDFTKLLEQDGTAVDDLWRAQRSAAVLDAFEHVRPDVLMIELFPFGRRQMRFELLPLLRAAREGNHRPIVVSSVRDILVGQDKPGRADKVCRLLQENFDHVLVHGDPDLVTLDATFPLTHRIEEMLTYTGYVADKTVSDTAKNHADEVIVSAGGGAVGARLLEVALQCRPLTYLDGHTWRVLSGIRSEAQGPSSPAATVPDGVIVEPARPDFPALLAACTLSISQGGYNTVVETLQARAPAVIVPFSAGGESEQTLRAELLAERGLVGVVSEAELTAQSLATAINSLQHKKRPVDSVDLSGAETTARLLEDLTQPAKRK